MRNGQNPYRLDGVSAGTRPSTANPEDSYQGSYPEPTPTTAQQKDSYVSPLQPGSDVAAPQPVSGYPQAQQQPQEQSFLGREPAQPSGGLARHDSSYRDWMAPAAAGVAGAGAGAAGYAAYQNQEGDDSTPHQQDESAATRDAPHTYQPSGLAAVPTEGTPTKKEAYYVEDTPAQFSTSQPAPPASSSMPPPSSTSVVPPTSTTTLGGLEREGAHETGAMFPKILRHDTDISVSNLHVPGKFPRAT